MIASLLISLTSLALFFAPPPTTPPAEAPKIPDSVFVSESPKDPKSVATIKKDAKKGDTVVFSAKIGGRAEPFVKNRAIFMVADRSLKSCNEIPGDTCAKPWDYCCESPESKKLNMMTLQFVGSDGKTLKVGAQGSHGTDSPALEPLALIVVEGTVTEKDDKGNCTVNITKIFVEKEAAK